MKKKNNGITLVALVITIIVMLILVGVTMNIAIGENGLISKTQDAKTDYKIEVEKEKLVNYEIEYYKVEGKGLEETTRQEMAMIAVETGISLDKLTVHYNWNHANINEENKNKELQEEYILYRYDKTTEEEREILETEGIKSLRGDVDLDGFLTQNDITRIIDNYNALLTPEGNLLEWSEIERTVGDINNDGDLGIEDHSYLAGIIAKRDSYEGGYIRE